MGSKKIILVHPPMYLDSLYGDLAAAGSELPPQGLCLLAAVLREAGFDPVIIDATAEKLTFDQTLKRIEENLPALFVGFSFYYISEKVVSQLAKSLKGAHPDLKIVVGGGHVWVLGEEVLEKYPQIDIGVVGEGERTIVELAKALEKEDSLYPIKGLVFRRDGRSTRTSARPFIENLDDLPFPAWDLLPPLTEYYLPPGDALQRWPSTILITSRGCPGNCYFCNKNAFGSRVRQNSPEYVIAEIKELQKKFGIKDICFQDDTFTANRDWMVEFCRRMMEEEIDLTWSCHGRADSVDLEMLKMMKVAGCWQVGFGIESGSQKVLDSLNKRTTVEQNKKALAMCRQAGLAAKGLLMVGSFGETEETLAATKKFIKENYMTECHITFYTIVPGTAAAKIWPKYGENPKTGALSMALSSPAFIPFGLTRKKLAAAHKDFYRTFYLRPRILWHFFKKLRYPYPRKKLLASAVAVIEYSLF